SGRGAPRVREREKEAAHGTDRDQRVWPDRPAGGQSDPRAAAVAGGGRRQRPGGCPDERAFVPIRQHLRQVSRVRRGAGWADRHQWAPHRRPLRARSRQAAVAGSRGRARGRIDGTVHRRQESGRTPRGGCQARSHQRAGDRRGRDGEHGRESRRLRSGETPHRQQRVVHTNLPSVTAIVDLTVALERPATPEEINRAYARASQEELKGYLGISEAPLVSTDFKGDPHSAVIDALSTMAVGDMVKVLSWYDNEWGYSCRVADLAAYMTSRGL